MGLFGGKNKQQKPAREEKVYRSVELPPSEMDIPRLSTREYRLFKQTERIRKSWYERLIAITRNFIKASPGVRSEKSLQQALNFTGIEAKPDEIMGLFLVTVIAFAALALVLFLTGLVTFIGIAVVVVGGALVGYYFMEYPKFRLKTMRIEASAQVVLAILYMVVSMRISPNLERALRFAAANVSGPLAWDMRKLLWDIEMGKYYSANEAMDYYIEKWKPENEEFSEAIRLIRDSETQAPQRGMQELDQALEEVLTGTKTRMKHYAQDLQTPVMVIHMMGIMLPILGTIMAPLAAVFMSDMVQPWHFILGYDIVLPIVIIWFINMTLSRRPLTVPQVDITNHPDVPKPGHFIAGGRNIPVIPIAIAIALIMLLPSVLFFVQHPENLFAGLKNREMDAGSLTMSFLLILGTAAGISSYFILSNYQRIGVQENVEKTEGEFELALFQLGHKIAGGTPTEVAVEKSIADMKDLEIAGLFQLTLRNIRNLGMTFEQALFDKNWGALKYYPSKLIRNIMYTVVDTSKKGVSYASESMLRISKYLQNIRETQEYIREMLSETVSSMKFQAYFLTPLITGLIVSMADVIVQVLSKIGAYLDSMGFGSVPGMPDVSSAFGNMDSVISPELFQLIIGVYLIEVIVILAMFLTKISSGENKALQWYSTGKMLIVAVVIYFLVAMVSTSVFGDMIRNALATLMPSGG